MNKRLDLIKNPQNYTQKQQACTTTGSENQLHQTVNPSVDKKHSDISVKTINLLRNKYKKLHIQDGTRSTTQNHINKKNEPNLKTTKSQITSENSRTLSSRNSSLPSNSQNRVNTYFQDSKDSRNYNFVDYKLTTNKLVNCCINARQGFIAENKLDAADLPIYMGFYPNMNQNSSSENNSDNPEDSDTQINNTYDQGPRSILVYDTIAANHDQKNQQQEQTLSTQTSLVQDPKEDSNSNTQPSWRLNPHEDKNFAEIKSDLRNIPSVHNQVNSSVCTINNFEPVINSHQRKYQYYTPKTNDTVSSSNLQIPLADNFSVKKCLSEDSYSGSKSDVDVIESSSLILEENLSSVKYCLDQEISNNENHHQNSNSQVKNQLKLAGSTTSSNNGSRKRYYSATTDTRSTGYADLKPKTKSNSKVINRIVDSFKQIEDQNNNNNNLLSTKKSNSADNLHQIKQETVTILGTNSASDPIINSTTSNLSQFPPVKGETGLISNSIEISKDTPLNQFLNFSEGTTLNGSSSKGSFTFLEQFGPKLFKLRGLRRSGIGIFGFQTDF